MSTRRALGLLTLTAMTPVVAAAEVSKAGIEAMLERARVVQESDIAAWGKLAFRRRAVSERLSSDGTLKDREDLEFQVRPAGDAFDELLLSINGKSPSADEVEEHRSAARFSRRYTKMRAGDDEEEEAGYSLGLLLKMSSSRYGGKETIDGQECHRIDFDGDPDVARNGIAGRVAAAMSGTLWLDVRGLHLVRAEAHSSKPVSAFLALARVSELSVSLESISAPGGVWVPKRIGMTTSGRVVGIPFSRRYLYEYSAYALPSQ